ncbi:hypothetical protein CRM22_007976 [Opisthorchis felineus]|uniref:Tubulin--tyrosine ligase-like protein 12 SET-like domain-containing protein n=1 Tax=Opisthorchis felineus TaxID=147828 RepID=A0A4S2LDC5_OPIFE|nr:hypothetical protein CRM22_007976 [Opisthorchis felineus]
MDRKDPVNGIVRIDFPEFLAIHEQQLRSGGIPGHFWMTLHKKLLDEIYDASAYFVMNRVEYEDGGDEDDGSIDWQIALNCERLQKTDPNAIFLVDHAWTFEINSMRQSLIAFPSLMDRMLDLMSIKRTDGDRADLIEAVCENVWKYCRYYKVSIETPQEMPRPSSEFQQIRWYVPDEVGSRIAHSDQPNGRMVPFFYIPRGVCYSVFWPTCDLLEGDELTLDYVEHIKDPVLRPLYLLPWQPGDFSDEPVQHSYVLSEQFFQSHRVQETLPVGSSTPASSVAESKLPLTVFTDIELVSKHLTDPRFKLVTAEKDASVLWLYGHFKSFKELTQDPKHQMVNQFPGEQVVTVKDLLAAIASLWASSTNMNDDSTQDFIDDRLTCRWYPVTFNLVHELPAFVSYFQQKHDRINAAEAPIPSVCANVMCPRKQILSSRAASTEFSPACERNLWILKPWNLGRGLGINISENLNQIIRLSDTNPLIASRYITDPVLFYREDIDANVKFDLRYVVFLRSVHPLKLYVYNVFWLRFANKAFCLSDFDDYNVHFTVMNYRENDILKQVHCDEFVQLFNEQYPNTRWRDVQADIYSTIVDLFVAASSNPAPRGLVSCDQSRALYAIDLLLEWRTRKVGTIGAGSQCHFIHPVICEVNYSPDCKRACQYHPDFFNHAFSCLFLNEASEKCNVTQLA